MNHKSEKRLSRDEMRAIMLSNAKVLMSEKFRTPVPEISGEIKKFKSEHKIA